MKTGVYPNKTQVCFYTERPLKTNKQTNLGPQEYIPIQIENVIHDSVNSIQSDTPSTSGRQKVPQPIINGVNLDGGTLGMIQWRYTDRRCSAIIPLMMWKRECASNGELKRYVFRRQL